MILHVLFVGYVQTPRWDGQTPYPPFMSDWVKIRVPQQHKVMLSFSHLDLAGSIYNCHRDVVQVYKETLSPSHRLLEVCSNYTIPPRIIEATMLYVYLDSWDPDAHSGFKLLFSFHNVSALPERLADNRWNCSVPHWSDFRQHFPCNLESDCVGGEDEADCPYTSDVCGQGFARMGQGCVLFVRTPTPVPWPEADMMCESRDMALISASTPEKWDALYNLLAYRPNENVLVGLKRSYQSVNYL